jgi:uncharacterized protein
MIVDLRRLEESRGRLTADETVPFTDAFGDEHEIVCNVALDYQRSGGAFFFHGDLAAEFQTRCHLCLEDTSCRVTGDFDLVVRKGEREAEAESGAAGEETEDLVTVSLNEYKVSLDQYIIENLIVNVPMKFLCKEDCKGLCPQCGVNRNKESCKCADAGDPRWDALRKLKNE